MPESYNKQQVTKKVRKLMHVFSRPWRFTSDEFFTGISVGISMFPDDGIDAETLIKNAGSAMYEVKNNGKGKFMFYNSSMSEKALNKLKTESNLRKALENNELTVFYQPVIDVATGNTIGVEALLRWICKDKDPALPADFITVAEETGLIKPIGKFVIKTACSYIGNLNKSSIDPIMLAINISARQFQQTNLAKLICNLLDQTGYPPTKLVLEITESTAINDIEHTVKRDFREFCVKVNKRLPFRQEFRYKI